MTERYARLAPHRARDAVAKLRERINVEIWSFLDTAIGLYSNGLADLHDAAVAIDVDGYFDVTAEAEDAKAEMLKRISEQHGQTLERERLAAEQAQVEADRKCLREEEEKRKAQPEPAPEPEPMPAAAEHKPLNTSRLSAAADPYSKPAPTAAKPETVTISRGEYDQLLADQAKLRALEDMGVDNWSGYREAMEQLAA